MSLKFPEKDKENIEQLIESIRTSGEILKISPIILIESLYKNKDIEKDNLDYAYLYFIEELGSTKRSRPSTIERLVYLKREEVLEVLDSLPPLERIRFLSKLKPNLTARLFNLKKSLTIPNLTNFSNNYYNNNYYFYHHEYDELIKIMDKHLSFIYEVYKIPRYLDISKKEDLLLLKYILEKTSERRVFDKKEVTNYFKNKFINDNRQNKLYKDIIHEIDNIIENTVGNKKFTAAKIEAVL